MPAYHTPLPLSWGDGSVSRMRKLAWGEAAQGRPPIGQNKPSAHGRHGPPRGEGLPFWRESGAYSLVREAGTKTGVSVR